MCPNLVAHFFPGHDKNNVGGKWERKMKLIISNEVLHAI